MTVLKNIVYIGATGENGRFLVAALEKSGKFNIKVLCRKRTEAYDQLPVSLRKNVHEIDYNSHDALVAALRGSDAVVTNVPFPSFDAADIEIPIIRAAIDAGVKLFVPSEWAVDTTAPALKNHPVPAAKRAVHHYLFAKSHLISYALIYVGVLPEYHLAKPIPPFFGASGMFGIDVTAQHANLPDGGIHPFSASTIATAGNSVVAVLSDYERSKNRILYFSDGIITALDVLAISEEVLGVKFTRESYSLEESAREVDRALLGGRTDKVVQAAALRTAFMAGLESAVFKTCHNEEFGVERQDIRGALKSVLNTCNGVRAISSL